MSIAQTADPASQRPLRLWLGVVAVVLLLVRYVLPRVMPEALVFGMLGEVVGGLAIIVWWAFFSRGPRVERWGAVLLMIVALFATSRVLDKSIATGMMGFMFPMFATPTLCIAFAVWGIFSLRLPEGPRRATMVATILLGCGAWAMLRTDGITGNGQSLYAWRWSKTHEEVLVAKTGDPALALPGALPAAPAEPPPPSSVAAKIPAPPTTIKAADRAVTLPATPTSTPLTAEPVSAWPGFRGPSRDSIIAGTRINPDWSAAPPVQLWRRPVGPGWSSFAVRGDLLYTQEQRGEDEVVACYNATTGNPVWAHRDPARFWESNAGAGPRGTPTLHAGRVYTLGATGIVNSLDARNGAVLWSRNAGTDTATKVPGWGFSGSPLVVGDMLVVAASGKLVAYDAATGSPRWFGPAGNGPSYSSPHLMTIGGVAQILLMSGHGATSVSPADGKMLWQHSWNSDTRIMQPALTADGDLLMSAGDAMSGVGIRRIAVVHGAAGWTAEERWTSPGLKPSFNDFVIHDGHVFGFDGGILACIDAKEGKRKWKGGRYGHGQLVLLRDQGLLLVLSEEGELALVKAATDQFTELAKFPALEGKTWNHPVLVGDRLFVRNDSEMVAFRLSLLGL